MSGKRTARQLGPAADLLRWSVFNSPIKLIQRYTALPVWPKNQNCRKDGQLFHPGVVSPDIVRYVFEAINGAHHGSAGTKDDLWRGHVSWPTSPEQWGPR